MSDPIRFENVHRSFDGREILRGLSFRVRPGEIYALLGRNGTGKTTALSILLGFLRPTGGESWLLGERSTDLSPAVRLRAGLVTEGHPMYRWMSIREAVAFEAGTRANFDRARAENSLARLGLSRDWKIKKLSRGQHAQVALVLALASEPDVLILDDPAMGLDAVMRRDFLDAMIDLLGREGRAVLFSSHILPDVERIADRVGILHEGRLMVDATIDDLKRRVQKRFVREDLPEVVPGLIRARPARGGSELLLLDVDDARAVQLAELFPTMSDPSVPTLEDLFIEMTSEPRERFALAV